MARRGALCLTAALVIVQNHTQAFVAPVPSSSSCSWLRHLQHDPGSASPRGHPLSMAEGDSDEAKPTSEDPSLGIKAAWYGSELFGNLIGLGRRKPPVEQELGSAGPIPRKDAAARLRNDFDRFYFVSGQMDLDLYEPDCVFADPFVAFEGRERFKNNLDNLGSLMQDVSLQVTSWEEAEASIKTKWIFRCVLGLPWKPTLAAAGGTEVFFNPSSGRIERHVESWDIKPIDALKQLLRPGRKRGSDSCNGHEENR